MKVTPTSLPDLLIIEPDVFRDDRGFFTETYHREKYAAAGMTPVFVQDNLSFSVGGTLRGLHYQYPHAQAKLVQVLSGEIYDLALDIRRGSPTFGRWTGIHLSQQNKKQLFIPEGFAHGFCVISESALFSYKCTDFYTPACECGILWCDPDLAVPWPVEHPVISSKDSGYGALKDVPEDRLPLYERP